MGTKLTAKKAGTCPECKKPWKVGEEAYWDSGVKNSAGFSVMCIDEDCFKEQGGKLTPRGTGSYNSNFKKSFSKPQVDVTLQVPEIDISDQTIYEALQTY
jgi:hypothetical protein